MASAAVTSKSRCKPRRSVRSIRRRSWRSSAVSVILPIELASLDNQLEGDCHFPLSALNQLRRDLVAKLGDAVRGIQPRAR